MAGIGGSGREGDRKVTLRFGDVVGGVIPEWTAEGTGYISFRKWDVHGGL